jgi:hypothetical protein
LRIGLSAALDVDAGKHHRSLGDFSGAVEDPHHRIGGDRFSGAGLADNAERLALGEGKVDVLHRLDDTAPGGELHREVANVEQGLRNHLTSSACAVRALSPLLRGQGWGEGQLPVN